MYSLKEMDEPSNKLTLEAMAKIAEIETTKDIEKQKIEACTHVKEYLEFLNTPLAPKSTKDFEEFKNNVLETLKKDLDVKLRF